MNGPELKELLSDYGKNPELDESALQQALADPIVGTAFKEWTRLHLSRENLLTKDELATYNSLDRSGHVDRLVSSQDMALVQAIGERDLLTAIQDLDDSTSSIKKHTDTMRQHQKALSKLADGTAKSHESQSQLVLKRQARKTGDRQKLNTKAEELSQTLDDRASDLEEQASAATDNVHETIHEILQSDDRLLSSLQKLGWELDPEDPEQKLKVQELRDICMRLIKYLVETIRTKLDRVYLEALSSAQHESQGDADSVKDLQILREEVESLYAEILPVAQMSVDQQHLEPALRTLSETNGESSRRSAAAVAYIDECLDYLLDHVARLSAAVDTLRSHQSASATMVETARKELKQSVTSPGVSGTRDQPVRPASPMRARRTVEDAITPARPNRNRDSDTSHNDTPVGSLLRHLAVSLPSVGDSDSGHLDSAKGVSALSRIRADRSTKSCDMARNVQESLEYISAAHALDAGRTIQLLRDSVLAESSFGDELKHIDPEFEDSIIGLGQEVARVNKRIEQIEALKILSDAKGEGNGAAASKKQQEILDRWGR